MNKLHIITALTLLFSCTIITKDEFFIADRVGLEKKDLVFIKNTTKNKIDELLINKNILIDPGVKGIISYASFEKTIEIQNKLKNYFKNKGFLVFFTGQFNNYEKQKNRLAIIKTINPYDIIIIQNTGKGRKNMTPEKIINKMKEWENLFKFEITGAQSYSIQADFIDKPDDMEKFADELTSFCPEILNDGTGKKSDLIKYMLSSNSFYLLF